jgi:hypothetical protein
LITEDTVKYIKARRMKGWRHLSRMEDIKLIKEIIDWSPVGVRTNRRPKNRWRDEVIKELKKIKLRKLR